MFKKETYSQHLAIRLLGALTLISVNATKTGQIISFTLVPFKGVFSFKGSNKIEIEYKNIERIGEDVVLVNYKD